MFAIKEGNKLNDDDDDIGAVECLWVTECDCLCDTDDATLLELLCLCDDILKVDYWYLDQRFNYDHLHDYYYLYIDPYLPLSIECHYPIIIYIMEWLSMLPSSSSSSPYAHLYSINLFLIIIMSWSISKNCHCKWIMW